MRRNIPVENNTLQGDMVDVESWNLMMMMSTKATALKRIKTFRRSSKKLLSNKVNNSYLPPWAFFGFAESLAKRAHRTQFYQFSIRFRRFRPWRQIAIEILLFRTSPIDR